MGCSDCKTGCGTSDGGCSTQKSAQRLFLDDLLPRIYPSRTYGQLDVAAAYEAGIREEECEQLGRQIATVTKAPVYLVPADDEELCLSLIHICSASGYRPQSPRYSASDNHGSLGGSSCRTHSFV